jgi:hypothetical protein
VEGKVEHVGERVGEVAIVSVNVPWVLEVESGVGKVWEETVVY